MGIDQYVIDAEHTKTNIKFINRSCLPNCRAQKVHKGDKPQIEIMGLRLIEAGEELTIDYRVREGARRPVECLCGSASCRQVIYVPREILRVLGSAFLMSVPLSAISLLHLEPHGKRVSDGGRKMDIHALWIWLRGGHTSG